MPNKTLQKLTQPKNSQEGQVFLQEVLTMIEQVENDAEVLKSNKEAVLLTFDDKKIDECLNTELRLDKETQTLKAAKKHLETTIDDLIADENKESAKQAKREALKAQKRGLEIYKEYQAHAKAIAVLIDELKTVEREIGTANNKCERLAGEHRAVASAFSTIRGNIVGYDLTQGHDDLGVRLPDPQKRGQFHIHMGR